jgi:hypothetical protein
MLKVYILLAISLFLTLIGKAQDQDFSFKENYKLSEPAKISVTTNDGNIKVSPSNNNEVEALFIVKKDGKVMDISRSKLEEDFTLTIVRTSNNLDIAVKPRKSYNTWRNRMSVSITLFTPKQTSCDLRSSDGNINLGDLTGRQEMKTSDGNITSSRVKGNIIARTSDGNIDITNIEGNAELITSDGNLDVKKVTGSVNGRTSDGNAVADNIEGNVVMGTSDGNAQANNVRGDLQLTTSDGDIRATNSKGNTKLKTSDGNVSFTDMGGSLSAVTSDGDIRGNMVSLKDNLYVKTTDGNIDVVVPDNIGLDLALRGQRINTKLNKFDGESKDRSVNGKINGGGIPIELTSSDGSVSLSYR